jgi:glycosyltransferase involved in cell wall biosynthesis
MSVPEITVCILTFKRPAMLTRLLETLDRQETGEKLQFSVLVTDNDREKSARSAVEEARAKVGYQIRYQVEVVANIARARNRSLDAVKSEFAAFIDDDELPNADWLRQLFEAAERYGADGILGPVQPRFDFEPPRWILESGVLNRPVLKTGLVLNYNQTRTGNVLLRRSLFGSSENRFDEAFASHGEDRNFFKRMIARGHTFVWCEEARAYETEPPERCRAIYHIRRALLRGSISWSHAVQKLPLLAKSVAAFGAYLLSLPVLLLRGKGRFMKYFIKMCDHLGCLLAVCGVKVERYIRTP